MKMIFIRHLGLSNDETIFKSLLIILSINFILDFKASNANPTSPRDKPIKNNDNSTTSPEPVTIRLRIPNPSIPRENCTPSNGCLRITRNDTVVLESKLNHIDNDTKQILTPKLRQPKKIVNSEVKRIDLDKFFRESVDNYPEGAILNALNNTSETVKKFFNLYNTPQDPHINLTERIASKSSDDYDDSNNNLGSHQEGREEPICRSIPKTIVPRDAWLNDRRVFIANDREFMQVVQAEICANVGSECNHLEGVLPEGMTSTCVQKYAYKRLLYLDSNNEKLSSDSFKYPSCCSCHIKYTHYDLRSFGNGGAHSGIISKTGSEPVHHLNSPPTSLTQNKTTETKDSNYPDSNQQASSLSTVIIKRIDAQDNNGNK